MIDFLFSIDLAVFYFINHTLSVGFLDKFFGFITNVNNWYLAYIILIYISFKYGGRRGKIAAVLTIFLITASDQFGAGFLKPLVHRLRPCKELADALTPLGCTGSFSFPSNHALNNFAAAVFFYKLFPKLKTILLVVATLIALSRVYLGLHYPSDIIGGAIIGAAFGYVFAFGALKIEGFLNKNKTIENSEQNKN